MTDYHKIADDAYAAGKKIDGDDSITVTGHTIQFETPYCAVGEVSFSNNEHRTVLLLPECVGVLPITDDKKVMLVRVLRPGALTKHFEIPQERLEPNEEIVSAIERCLHEEVGVLSIKKIESLITLPSFPDRSNEKTHLACAWGSFDAKKHTDKQEIGDQEIRAFSFEEIISEIKKGSISCAVTIAAIFLAQKNNFL